MAQKLIKYITKEETFLQTFSYYLNRYTPIVILLYSFLIIVGIARGDITTWEIIGIIFLGLIWIIMAMIIKIIAFKNNDK